MAKKQKSVVLEVQDVVIAINEIAKEGEEDGEVSPQ